MTSTYYLDCIAGNVFGSKTSPALPEKLYLGLSTTAPSEDGTNIVEPSVDAGYARVELTGLGEPADGVVTNTQAYDFAKSTASWGTVTHLVIFDSADQDDSHFLMSSELEEPRVVGSGTVLHVLAGSLTLNIWRRADA
jgi:hypothetical protein